MYDVDYQKVGKQNLRPKHRNSNQKPFYDVLVAGLVALNERFARFRESVDYQQLHDSRKCHIEKVLNDAFDALDRRIYIGNEEPVPGTYFYEPATDRDVIFYEPEADADVYFYQGTAVEIGTANFIVYLPDAIKPAAANELRKIEININTLVNRYKCDSKEHALLWTQ